MRFEFGIEAVEHQTGLDLNRALVHIEVNDLTDVFAVVNHQARAGGLAALAGAAAARHDGHA